MLNKVEAQDAHLDAHERSSSSEDRAQMRRSTLGILSRVIAQIVLMVAILAGAVMAMNALMAATPERGGRPDVDVAVPVDAVVAQTAAQQPVIRLFGEVVAARTIDLRAAVGGEVVSVGDNLVEGLTVRRGQTLFTIDPFEYEIALAEAEASLAQQRASTAENRARIVAEQEQLQAGEEQLALAIADLERAQTLRNNGTLTQKQVDDRELLVSQRRQTVSQRRNNLTVEQARLDGQMAIDQRLELGVERARRNLDNTTVVAPFDGTIRNTSIEIGRIVSANDVAVSMYEAGALDVTFTLTDAQYGRIATDDDPLIGRIVDIKWSIGDTAYHYKGTVQRIGADIAAERGGVTVFARLENNDATVDIRPGAFVEVRVPDKIYRDAVRIPDTALYGTSTVYVISEGALRQRAVTVAGYDGSDVIVADGLADGERILTTRLASVEEGLSVSVPALDGDDVANETSPDGGR